MRRGIIATLAALAVVLPVAATAAGAQDPEPARTGAIGRVPPHRDSVVIVRFSDSSGVRMQLDSLLRDLETVSVNSAEHRQLQLEVQRLLAAMREMHRGQNVRVAVTRHMTEGGGEAARILSVPRGWIGINVEGPHVREVSPEGLTIRYFFYPEVSSVEPRSPAESAGVLRGDVLIAYNGEDVVERTINVTRLLEPSKRVVLTVRRDGVTREIPVTIARAPELLLARRQLADAPHPHFSLPHLSEGAGQAPPSSVAPARLKAPPTAAEAAAAPTPSGRAAVPARQPPPLAPAGEGAPRSLGGFDTNSGALFGAALVTVNPELGRALGVRGGLLVTSVADGTPARQAGLRGGDVIARAAGVELQSVLDLRRAAADRPNATTLELEIVREGKARPLTLRW